MRRVLRLACALAAAWLLLPGAAQAASFDCRAKGLTPVERRICTNAQLSALDAQLALAFGRARRLDPAATAAQRDWIATRRNRCGDDGCLFTAYTERLAALRALAHDCPLREDALLGDWLDADPAGGPFDSVAFSRDADGPAFASWLHHAPFANGTWAFKNCSIHVVAAAGQLAMDFTVLDVDHDVLRLASDLDDRPIALKRAPRR